MGVMEVLLPSSSVLVLAVTGAFLLVFVREPWIRHPFGQSVLVLTLGVLLLAGLGLAVYVLGPDYPGREYAVLTGRLLIATAMAQRLVVLIRERRKDRHNQGDPR
ncbi:hypothetical protein ASE01_20140 [Nocardioides sp. Root190]|uniref:putative phage holin n=1 Tax=Nocardioides sp. Root190 TaxID=1736488 RepID=UPI0006F55ACE|nr:hypothetical protein [Nocardioides sp. Root190]KRB73088.1 hypothetical protein ASE01_20140 [Nocardioides sp. Root190]